MKPKLKSALKWLFILFLIGILTGVAINVHIQKSTSKFISGNLDSIPKAYTCIVLGAFVGENGTPSTVLADRLNTALNLYQNRKITRFLLTGDHGRRNYDEVNNMRKYLEEKGVPRTDIFMDHAGFDTYNSMVRACEIFCIDEAIIVTQQFHLPRAIYIAKKKGMKVYGFEAPMSIAKSLNYLKFRESLACIKAYGEVLINRKPHFLGSQIPITGDSKPSYD